MDRLLAFCQLLLSTNEKEIIQIKLFRDQTGYVVSIQISNTECAATVVFAFVNPNQNDFVEFLSTQCKRAMK